MRKNWVGALMVVIAVALVCYGVIRELESRGYIDLPRAETPMPATVEDAYTAVVGDQDATCLESDVEVLRGYWRWVAQFSHLEDLRVQRGGANNYIYLVTQHRIELIDLAPTHGCTQVFEALDDMAFEYIRYIEAFRQDEDENKNLGQYLKTATASLERLHTAIRLASMTEPSPA